MVRELTITAGEEESGLTVREILKSRFGLVDHDISRAKYRRDGICVNGQRTYVTTVLQCGDVLRVRIEDEPLRDVAVSDEPLDILYEDDDLLAVNKPAGVVVHPSHGHFADSLGNAVAGHYLRNGEAHDIRTIGRLDKDTSGVMLYGKTRSAVYLLTKQHEAGLFRKTYLALIWGRPDETGGTFDGPIGRVPGMKLKRKVRPDGDAAVTHYEVIGSFEAARDPDGGVKPVSLVRVWLETGRTHQIRVHFSTAGYPLVGDELYGGKPGFPADCGGGGEGDGGVCRAALHCWKVTCLKPFSDEDVALTAPLPDDMAALIPADIMSRLT